MLDQPNQDASPRSMFHDPLHVHKDSWNNDLADSLHRPLPVEPVRLISDSGNHHEDNFPWPYLPNGQSNPAYCRELRAAEMLTPRPAHLLIPKPPSALP